MVLGQIEDQLHGAAHASRIFGDQQGAFARGHALRHAAPEPHSAVARQRVSIPLIMAASVCDRAPIVADNRSGGWGLRHEAFDQSD